MKDWIYDHKQESVLIAIGIMMFLFILIFVKIFFFSSNGNAYGDRLDGIEKIKISHDKLKKIESELEGKEGIQKGECYVTGKVVNIFITVSTSDFEALKTEMNSVVSNFNQKEKEFYDIQVFLTGEEQSGINPVIGYLGKGSEALVWTNS